MIFRSNEIINKIFQRFVSLRLSQETKILTKAVFCFQLLEHPLDGILQIFNVSQFSQHLPMSRRAGGDFLCAVPHIPRRGTTEQFVDGAAQHRCQQRELGYSFIDCLH